MADHDGHTTNVGPVTVGIDTDRIRNFGADLGDGDRLCDEVDRLRDLLRQALPWIDPNDRHEDYLLTVAIREALGEPT